MYLRNDHTYSAVELYKTYNLDRLKGKGKIARHYKCRDKKALAQKIFLRYLYLLVRDLIEGGKIFHFPSQTLASLRMHKIAGEHFKYARKRGKFKEVDFLKSDFSAYLLVMDYETNKGVKITRQVVMSENLAKMIIDKTNEGYKYS